MSGPPSMKGDTTTITIAARRKAARTDGVAPGAPTLPLRGPLPPRARGEGRGWSVRGSCEKARGVTWS